MMIWIVLGGAFYVGAVIFALSLCAVAGQPTPPPPDSADWSF